MATLYSDFLVDPETGDLDVSQGLQLIDSNQISLRQRLWLRFNIWQGDWYFEETIGFPYRTYISKKVMKTVLDNKIREVCRLEPDVLEINDFQSSMDHTTRTYEAYFEVITRENEIIRLAFIGTDSFSYPEPDDEAVLCDDTRWIAWANKLYYLINFRLPEYGNATWWNLWAGRQQPPVSQIVFDKALINGYEIDASAFVPQTSFVGAQYQLSVSGNIGPLTWEVTGPASVSGGLVTITGSGDITVKAIDARGDSEVTHSISPKKWFIQDNTQRRWKEWRNWCSSMSGRMPTDLEILTPHNIDPTKISRAMNGSLWAEWGDMKTYGWPGDGQTSNTQVGYWWNGSYYQISNGWAVMATALAGRSGPTYPWENQGINSNGSGNQLLIDLFDDTVTNRAYGCCVIDVS